MKVGLIAMRWCDYGGWPSYTKHLYFGLKDAGHEPVVLTDGKVMPGWKKVMNFGPLSDMGTCDKTIITVIAPDEKLAKSLKGRIDALVLHDPTEWRRKVSKATIKAIEPKLAVFIRAKSMKTFKAAGFYRRAKSEFILHPYKRICEERVDGDRVVCTARIDHDKRTHILVAADRGIELWTGYVNWVYDQEKFGAVIRKRPFYKGKFGFTDEDVAKVYEGTCALVDMSKIVGDGGGTQYTFLEAMDFGSDCILASDWTAGKNPELIAGKHYHEVGNVKQLQETIDTVRETGPVLTEGAEEILAAHDAKVIAEQFLQLI
jgi:hypothetical protein